MDLYALCMLFPPGWERLDVDEDQIGRRIDERFSAYALAPEPRQALVTAEVGAVERSRRAGNVAWAAKVDGDGSAEQPLSTLSLTVAVTPAPPPEPAARPDPTPGTGTRPGAVRLDVPGASGTLRERRTVERPAAADREVTMFHSQAVVVPDNRAMIITVTVTTPDPAKEDEARRTTTRVATALRLVPIRPGEIS